jgi:DNA-binding NarL/FixJ family response regulator
MDRPYLIVLADDHIRFRREMRKILEELSGIKVVGEAGDRRELFELLEQSRPEMVILDVAMADLRGREGAYLIKLRYPGMKIMIMVMDHAREYLSYGLAAGATGILPKQYVAGQIAGAIAAVRRGKIFLPPQTPEKSNPWTTTTAATDPAQFGVDSC